MNSAHKTIQSFESRGEENVRKGLMLGEFGSGGLIHVMATQWLASKEALRAAAKEEEMLSIARNARSLARQANKIAIIAIVLSVAIAIIQMFKS